MDEQAIKLLVLCCCGLSRTFSPPGTTCWRVMPIGLEEARVEVDFFCHKRLCCWFAFASAVGRQSVGHSSWWCNTFSCKTQPVAVLQRPTARPQIISWKNHIIFQSIPEGSSLWFSGAYDFEALSCQCGLQFQALNTDLSSGEFGGVAYFPFFNEAKGCCVFWDATQVSAALAAAAVEVQPFPQQIAHGGVTQLLLTPGACHCPVAKAAVAGAGWLASGLWKPGSRMCVCSLMRHLNPVAERCAWRELSNSLITGI